MSMRKAGERLATEATRDVDPRLRELYAATPDEFVKARDGLARALASEKSSEADRVRRLRRPTLAIWLLNAVARDHPGRVASLFEAGDHLRKAQGQAGAGQAAELRALGAALHDALESAVAAVRELAAHMGRETDAAALGQIRRGLRAVATTDMAARTPLRQGVLERLPELGGMDFLAEHLLLDPGTETTRHAPVPQPDEERPDSTRRLASLARDEAPRALREAERARRAAEKNARAEAARRDRERRRALAEAEGLERTCRAAEKRVQEAERKLQQAQRGLAAAQKEVEATRRAALAAQASADAARKGISG